jgi:hypothetical protein
MLIYFYLVESWPRAQQWSARHSLVVNLAQHPASSMPDAEKIAFPPHNARCALIKKKAPRGNACHIWRKRAF